MLASWEFTWELRRAAKRKLTNTSFAKKPACNTNEEHYNYSWRVTKIPHDVHRGSCSFIVQILPASLVVIVVVVGVIRRQGIHFCCSWIFLNYVYQGKENVTVKEWVKFACKLCSKCFAEQPYAFIEMSLRSIDLPRVRLVIFNKSALTLVGLHAQLCSWKIGMSRRRSTTTYWHGAMIHSKPSFFSWNPLGSQRMVGWSHTIVNDLSIYYCKQLYTYRQNGVLPSKWMSQPANP